MQFLVCGLILLLFSEFSVFANKQDTVYLFAYSVNQGRSGLTLAWSLDKTEWHPIGPEYCFLFSDFGTWGSQKRMHSPFLYRDDDGMWHCFWTLNDDITQFAHAASENLYEWGRQSYPIVMPGGNVLDLEVTAKETGWDVSWMCNVEGKEGVYRTITHDFKHYSETQKITEKERHDVRVEAEINGRIHTGMIVEVAWEMVEELIVHEEWMRYHNQERNEVMADDPVRFSGLKPIDVSITPQPEREKEISDMLIGIFFEDISYAADGGLYAELVQNRGFEYKPSDTKGRDRSWNAKKGWQLSGNASFDIGTEDPLHENNSHYAVIEIEEQGAALVNEGWDGIAVEEGKKYDFSVFARLKMDSKMNLIVRIIDKNGKNIGEAKMKLNSDDWKKYNAVISVKSTCEISKLEIVPQGTGTIHFDMISLFPEHTFMNRKNGLRADLAQAIADLNPKFVRFPGGCVAHGDGIDNIYRWENTIGPLESRVPQMNIWRYHQSAGLGYFEYFQFCEDIDAEPLPVVAAGVPCQNSSIGGHGQQCGIPMGEMDEYVQSVLDLIEWANGDAKSEWGRKRAEAGHPEPFNLKYIGVGNEDLITDVFEERFTMIYYAVREKYPEITVIGTVGPFYRGTDYEEGWDLARKLKIPIVDEHYYQPPGWFINNQDFYDKYDRNGTKVYLGEYASHVHGRRTNMETSLSEALYLTAIERNADIVCMTSYAPLLAKERHTNWNPDLIYFNNTEVKPTVDYYVQKLYGNHSGDKYIPAHIELSSKDQKVSRRFGYSMVEDSKTGDIIIKLVNLLPVDIKGKINLEKFELQGEGKMYILQGEQGDEKARPVEKTILTGSNLKYTIPPYSFTVMRFSKVIDEE